MVVIAGRRFALPDLIMIGAGGAMAIDSLLPWYGYDARGWHPTYTAYQSGFLAFFPMLIVLLIAGVVATRVWNGSNDPTLGAGQLTWNLLYLIGDAVALLLILLFWTTLPGLQGASTGVKVGLFAGLVFVLAQAVGVFLAMVVAGERIAMRSWQRARSLRVGRSA